MTKPKASKPPVKRPRRRQFDPERAAETLKSVFDTADNLKQRADDAADLAAKLKSQIAVERENCGKLTTSLRQALHGLEVQTAACKEAQAEAEYLRQYRTGADKALQQSIGDVRRQVELLDQAKTKNDILSAGILEVRTLLADQKEMTTHWREAYDGLKLRMTGSNP